MGLQIKHIHFIDEQNETQRYETQTYENITASSINFLNNIYIQDKSQRYTFRIYTSKSGFIETERY